MIPNGVMTHENRKANLITQKFGLHKDEYICALSRLTEEKGIHFLIEAYKELKTDKKLVIAGAASDTDEYVKMLKEMAGMIRILSLYWICFREDTGRDL